jgi:hypothetical protein
MATIGEILTLLNGLEAGYKMAIANCKMNIARLDAEIDAFKKSNAYNTQNKLVLETKRKEKKRFESLMDLAKIKKHRVHELLDPAGFISRMLADLGHNAVMFDEDVSNIHGKLVRVQLNQANPIEIFNELYFDFENLNSKIRASQKSSVRRAA